MSSRPATSPTELAPLAIIGVLGAFALAVHVARYPTAGVGSLNLALFSWPRADKLLGLAVTLLWLAGINLAAWSCGVLAERLRSLPPGLVDFRGLYRIGIGSAVLALLLLLLAAVHLLVPAAFLGLLVLPPLTLAALRSAAGSPTSAGARHERLRHRTLLAGAAGAVLLANAFMDALDPDPGWDALTYHLAFPERYLFENGVVMTPFSHLSGYIMLPQMLYLLALGVDGTCLAVLLHFEFGVLILVSLWRLGRRISPGAAVLAPLLLLVDPLFQMELGWAYADLMLAFYATLACIACFAWMEDPRQTSALLYAGVLCGICCSTRYPGVVVLLSLCVLVWMPPRHRELRANLGACLRLASSAGAMLLPWLVRNAVFTGNPVAPFLQSVFHAPGEEYIDPLVMRQSTAWVREIGMGRDLAALVALPWNLSMVTKIGLYSDGFGFQISPLYAVGALAALMVREVRRHPLVRPALLLILVQVLFWFYSVQEPRFLLPAFAFCAFVGGVAIDRLASRAAPWGRVLLALPLAAALYCQLLKLPSLPERYAFAMGSLPRDYYEQREPVQRAAALLREQMGSEDRLLLLFETRGFLFRGLRYVPYHGLSGSPVLRLVHEQPDPQQLHCRLQRLGVTHLLWNRSAQIRPVFLSDYTYRDYLADQKRLELMLETGGERLFRQGGVQVYRLRPLACDDGSQRISAPRP